MEIARARRAVLAAQARWNAWEKTGVGRSGEGTDFERESELDLLADGPRSESLCLPAPGLERGVLLSGPDMCAGSGRLGLRAVTYEI